MDSFECLGFTALLVCSRVAESGFRVSVPFLEFIGPSVVSS